MYYQGINNLKAREAMSKDSIYKKQGKRDVRRLDPISAHRPLAVPKRKLKQ